MVFTHLLTKARPKGSYIITIRSPEFARSKGKQIDKDIVYVKKNENEARLNVMFYGQTTVSHEYILSVVKFFHDDVKLLDYFVCRDFDYYQETYIFSRK